jgi:hypothetical protein
MAKKQVRAVLKLLSLKTEYSKNFFFSVLAFELRPSCIARQALYLPLKPLHQPFFVLGIFEIGSFELFAWAGFEL